MTKAQLLALCEPLAGSRGGMTPHEDVLMMYAQGFVYVIAPADNKVLLNTCDCHVMQDSDWQNVRVFKEIK